MSLNVCALFLPLRLLYHLLYYCSKECRSAEHREDEEKAEEKCLSSEAVGSVVMSNRDPPTYTEDEKDYLDIEALKRKLEETESAMTKIIARMSRIVPKTQVRLLICFSFDPPLIVYLHIFHRKSDRSFVLYPCLLFLPPPPSRVVNVYFIVDMLFVSPLYFHVAFHYFAC